MGKIKKIIGAFIHAPERFDELAGRIADVNEKRAALNSRIDGMMADLENDIDEISGRINGVDSRTDGLAGRVAGLNGRVDGLNGRVDGLAGRVDGQEDRIGKMDISWYMDQLCEDRALLARLNRGLSIAPTVWGDPERLEIDESAAVFTCFFNTNSGRIKVGESTFAGSGVSLLAGSHDPQLTGFMRRDAEMSEGCDITIGSGVWLASGCTLLGPCTVGDNAVIAAGAVVTPGTEVPACTIWGGVPARQIGELKEKMMTPENPAVKRAFERSGGMLFADGWGEKTPGICSVPGHWMCRETASLMTDRTEWKLEYRKEENGENRIHLTGPAGETDIVMTESEGEMLIHLPVREDELGEVRLMREGDKKVFLAWSEPGAAGSPAGTADAETGTADTAGGTSETEAGAADPEAETAGQAPQEEEKTPETAEVKEAGETEEEKLDIEKIMEEIRAEARKWAPEGELPAFDKMPKSDTRKCAKMIEQVRQLTDDVTIPVQYQDPSRNPLKRAYKKMMQKAVNCATAPMSVRVTETNTALKTALEKALEVIEEQEKRIAELEKKAE